jgi:AP-1 complex subunit beta-1
VGAPAGTSSMDDMMGLFDMNGSSSSGNAVQNDMMNGFAGLDLSGASQPPPASTQLHGGAGPKKTNEDLLGMF